MWGGRCSLGRTYLIPVQGQRVGFIYCWGTVLLRSMILLLIVVVVQLYGAVVRLSGYFLEGNGSVVSGL